MNPNILHVKNIQHKIFCHERGFLLDKSESKLLSDEEWLLIDEDIINVVDSDDEDDGPHIVFGKVISEQSKFMSESVAQLLYSELLTFDKHVLDMICGYYDIEPLNFVIKLTEDKHKTFLFFKGNYTSITLHLNIDGYQFVCINVNDNIGTHINNNTKLKTFDNKDAGINYVRTYGIINDKRIPKNDDNKFISYIDNFIKTKRSWYDSKLCPWTGEWYEKPGIFVVINNLHFFSRNNGASYIVKINTDEYEGIMNEIIEVNNILKNVEQKSKIGEQKLVGSFETIALKTRPGFDKIEPRCTNTKKSLCNIQ